MAGEFSKFEEQAIVIPEGKIQMRIAGEGAVSYTHLRAHET